MCTFFTIDKYYYVFLKCVNKDIINLHTQWMFISGRCQKKSEFDFLYKSLAHRVHFISWHRHGDVKHVNK